MSTFKKYPRIHRLGKEETDGILDGTVEVQEKIDGANTSIWIDKRGDLTYASRNKELSEGFNGFVEYVKDHDGVNKLLQDNPTWRLYGEWLVRHTIGYNETNYKQFYLFDITEMKDGEEVEIFFDMDKVYQIAKQYEIKTPHHFGTFTNTTEEKLNEFVGKSVLGDKGEGVVIKNLKHVDNYGNHCHAKIVTQNFREDNAVTFGGNNKHSDTYWEMYIVNKYISLPRIEKIMHKIQPTLDERLDLQHCSQVANTVFHDMLTEEIWEISKKVVKVNFKALKNLSIRKAVQIYKNLLTGDVSVADKDN